MKINVPIASHGLHTHKYQTPYCGTFNFGDVVPVFYQQLCKNEKISIRGGNFARLNALPNPAFATGRFVYRAFFVPYKYVYRPWYAFNSGVSYPYNHSQAYVPKQCPYTYMSLLNRALATYFASSDDLIEPTTLAVATTNHNFYDFAYLPSGSSTATLYRWTTLGTRVFKILCSLGVTPNFAADDDSYVNILALLSYIKVFMEFYFPKNFYDSSVGLAIRHFILLDTEYYGVQNLEDLLLYAKYWSSGFYEDSFFDQSWVNPVAPNNITDSIDLKDNANNYPFPAGQVSSNIVHSEGVVTNANNNGTPSVQSNYSSSQASNHTSEYVYRLNKYILDALTSVTNYVKRHQLAGGRLLENFLLQRGVKLNNDDTMVPYSLGSCFVEIDVDSVANTTDVGLGDLAGKGVASSKDLNFKYRAIDDGIFMIVAHAVADWDTPVFLDEFATRTTRFQFYQSEFDKLGTELVPSKLYQWSRNGAINTSVRNYKHGFFGRYYGEVMSRPRYVGDFLCGSRGATQLKGFVPFRLTFTDVLGQGIPSQDGACITLDYLSQGVDSIQYQRLFQSSECDNIQNFIRLRVNLKKYKLPLGDSYNWDDDEFNDKVSVELSGNLN